MHSRLIRANLYLWPIYFFDRFPSSLCSIHIDLLILLQALEPQTGYPISLLLFDPSTTLYNLVLVFTIMPGFFRFLALILLVLKTHVVARLASQAVSIPESISTTATPPGIKYSSLYIFRRAPVVTGTAYSHSLKITGGILQHGTSVSKGAV